MGLDLFTIIARYASGLTILFKVRLFILCQSAGRLRDVVMFWINT